MQEAITGTGGGHVTRAGGSRKVAGSAERSLCIMHDNRLSIYCFSVLENRQISANIKLSGKLGAMCTFIVLLL